MIFDPSDNIDLLKAKAKFNTFIEQGKPFELKAIRKKRSIRANAYLHVCISLFAIEVGSTLLEAKTDLKRERGLYYVKNGNKYLKQTSQMDSKELADFIDWIRTFASKQGIYIPSSDEYILNSIAIDKTIKNNKQFL